MSLKNPSVAITSLENFSTESFQLGFCPLVLLTKASCNRCEKKMYPILALDFHNVFEDLLSGKAFELDSFDDFIKSKLHRKFICYQCGDIK